MSRGVFYTCLGISASVITTGATMISDSAGTGASVGIILVGIGIIAMIILMVIRDNQLLKSGLRSLISELENSLRSSMSELENTIKNNTKSLKDAEKEIAVMNDSRFISDGFIGLQKEFVVLENNVSLGLGPTDRMGVFGHLPSHIRNTDLEVSRGKILYFNWESPQMIPTYVKFVNERRMAMLRFLDSGRICREVYEQAKIEQYLKDRYTFHDRVVDPLEEIEERFDGLRLLLKTYQNYYLYFIPSNIKRTGPYYLLKQNVGLILDLRTNEAGQHFTDSIDGLFTNSRQVMDYFAKKFVRTVTATAENVSIDEVEKYLDEIKKKRKAGEKRKRI